MRFNDRVWSGWFVVEQGLRQGCGLAPFLFKVLFAVVMNMAYKRFKAESDTMDALVAWGQGGATVIEPVLATSLWGMLYADDAEVISHSPEQLRRMVGVIVVLCAAFGLTIWEAKTEIMCLRTKGMPAFEGFNDWGGRGYDDFVSGEVTKTALSGDETT